jgi:alkyl hydroperoxide reductase subunit AhpF
MVGASLGDFSTLRDRLQSLSNSVTLMYYTPDVPSAATRQERALLEELVALSDKVHLRVFAERWDAERESQVGIARTPAIIPIGSRDYGIRYYGTPDGYELETFLEVLQTVAAGQAGLSASIRDLLRALTVPLHLEVLHAPT